MKIIGAFRHLDAMESKLALILFLPTIIVFYMISYRSGLEAGLRFGLIIFAFAFAIAFAFMFVGSDATAYALPFAVRIVFAVAFTVTFAVAFGITFAVTIAIAYAFAATVAFAFGVAVVFAGSVALADVFIVVSIEVLIISIIFAGLQALASATMFWRAVHGDERQTIILKLGLVFGRWGSTSFHNADLTEATFREATMQVVDLRGAQFMRTRWIGAKKLLLARRTGTILEDYTVRALLESGKFPNKSLAGKNLKGAYLAGFDLSNVDFTEADLSEADLRGANLTNANLTKVHAIGALFEGADLTGACIEDWNIDHTTQLKGVVCRYVYMLNGQRERQPSAGEFQEGQFAALFEKVFDTVNFIFTEKGIDWQAFTQVFGQMQVAYGEHGAELAVQAIERKSDGTFIVKVKVPPETDKAVIQQEFFREYENRLALLEAKYQTQLQAKNEVIAVYREQNARMDIIVNTLAQTNLSAKLAHQPVKILFLAANPQDTVRLRLDEEVRAIDLALQQSKFRDKFELAQHWAVRLAELQSLLLRHEPAIVHFSGHGGVTGELKFEDSAMGESQAASLHALSRLFEILHDKIRCVVLNACYTKPQATEIAKHVPCVIGMSKAVGDAAAIQFAAAFYQALGYGHNIRKAFELGCVQINLVGLQEQDTPQLLTRRAGEEEMVLVQA